MRSEKDQMTVGKDKTVVEIQFRDIPRDQENCAGGNRQKEEKKEVFTKVRSRVLSVVMENRHGGGGGGLEGGGITSVPRTAAVETHYSSFLTFQSDTVLMCCLIYSENNDIYS